MCTRETPDTCTTGEVYRHAIVTKHSAVILQVNLTDKFSQSSTGMVKSMPTT